MKIKLLLLSLLVVQVAFGKNKLEVLIVTGQSNHNWQLSSKAVHEIFNASDLFNATIVVSPEKGSDMSNFCPDFKKYDLVCLDYNGDYWPKKTQKNFVKYIKKGGGLVLYHSTDNSFSKWKEFNEIIGVGGWGHRNEEHGPILYWEDDKIKKDHSPGKGGIHGKSFEYLVQTRKPNHPIMKGLPISWLHTKDELYHSLRGPAKNVTVLATSQQDKAAKGSGRQEPVLMTIEYGKGRVFHSVMGHVSRRGTNIDAVLCNGFVISLLRGAEWVATGDVKQKSVYSLPNNTKTKTIKTKD
jgi:type 1 glutamine amidotransferase